MRRWPGQRATASSALRSLSIKRVSPPGRRLNWKALSVTQLPAITEVGHVRSCNGNSMCVCCRRQGFIEERIAEQESRLAIVRSGPGFVRGRFVRVLSPRNAARRTRFGFSLHPSSLLAPAPARRLRGRSPVSPPAPSPLSGRHSVSAFAFDTARKLNLSLIAHVCWTSCRNNSSSHR